jgi:hypothetical protein
MRMHKIFEAFEDGELQQLGDIAELAMARECPYLDSDEDRRDEFYSYFAKQIEKYIVSQDFDDIITHYIDSFWEDFHSNKAWAEKEQENKYLARKEGI